MAICYMQLGLLDEAETMILGTPASNVHGCLLRIRLSVKRQRTPDTLALIDQLRGISEATAPHILSLMDFLGEGDDLIRLHLLRAAHEIDPAAGQVASCILSLAANCAQLDAKERVEVVLFYLDACADRELVRRVAWNIGQLAVSHEMHAEAVVLFDRCVQFAENDEDRLLALFFRIQSAYHSNAIDEQLLRDIEKHRELAQQARSANGRPKKEAANEIPKLLAIFQAKALVHLERWDELQALIAVSPSRHLVPMILASSSDVPAGISLLCLHRLVEEIHEIDIVRFSSLMRGLCTAALVADGNAAIAYFRQAVPLLSSRYPREERLWLCVTCFNTATLTLSWKNATLAQEWCELAIGLAHHLEPDDKLAYEPRIRDGYTRILQQKHRDVHELARK